MTGDDLAGGETGIGFPDVPKLELDELIDQLVERAQDVQRAQARMRSLLRAIGTISGELSLEAVLRTIVEAGCRLAGANYGALGVIAPNGGLEQFVHVGIDPATTARIGHLPTGEGLLGALITDPRTIRLDHMRDDPRSSGFPPDHPPMDSFLGVPIRIRDEVFGNLYLTDSAHGGFTTEDEELVVALASAAGSAISNARLYTESRRQQGWLTASVDIGAQLLSSTGEHPLRMIARKAHAIADADLVALSLLDPDGTALIVEHAEGLGAELLVGQRYALGATISGECVRTAQPVMHNRVAPVLLENSPLVGVIDAGPMMAVPLNGADVVRGVLAVVRTRDRRPFTAGELEMAAGFAAHASVALELADSRAAEQKVLLLEDRDRIARDLHDHVIQELFAIGMSLESIATQLGPDSEPGLRLHERVDDLDRTIRRIRTSIFALRGPLDLQVDSLRQRILEIVSDLTPALGFPPHVAFDGAVDTGLSAEVADDVAAVVREALINVAKHAQARRAYVDLTIAGREAVLVVADNGVGHGVPEPGSGVSGMRSRAEERGGSFETTPAPGGGTKLTWRVPAR